MSILAQSVTQTLDQIELVNIVSVSELRLQRNFELLIQALQSHTARFDSMEQTMRFQAVAIQNLTEAHSSELQEHTSRLDDLAAKCQSLQANLSSSSEQIQQNHSKCRESVGLLSDQLRIANQLGDDRNSQTQDLFRDISKQLQSFASLTGRIDSENERFRKESGLLSVKADTAFKKAKLIEEKIDKMDQRVSKVTADNVVLRQTITHSFGEEAVPFLEVDQNFGEVKQEGDQQKQTLFSRATERRKFTMVAPGEGFGMRGNVEELRKRVESLEFLIKDHNFKSSEKINQQVNQIKTLKIELKKELMREKSQHSFASVYEKIEQLKPQINRVASRIDVVQDRNQIMDKKIQQTKRNLFEINTLMKQNNSYKFDDRIQMLQSDFLSQLKDLENRLDDKTDFADFVKERDSKDDAIREVNEILRIKCDKMEVKKALLFIEAKIKEIILVISEDEENQKQALLTKKHVKCISCDKDLDKFAGLVNTDSKNWNMMPCKDLNSESLGRFGISKYGTLAKKLRKLEANNDLPILRARKATE